MIHTSAKREKFRVLGVDYGDRMCESAALRGALQVKLFAKEGEGNKPRQSTLYYLQQTLL